MNPRPASAVGEVLIRDLAPGDDIPSITKLLHRAYAKQIAMGLRPLAGRQEDSVTAERAANSECIVAILAAPNQAERIVGVILFEEQEKVDFPPWFLRPDVCHFAQFAVDPEIQGMGIGRRLLDEVERRARAQAASELALSMAEPDRELFDFYIKRGYRLVDHWQWPYTNYRSCILSKSLLSG
jgi:predicted N-acetyltransferase YhbS